MSEIAIVTSMGKETFTVLVPSIGVTQKVNIPRDHPRVKFTHIEAEKRTRLVPLEGHVCDWTEMDVVMFGKIIVSCHCTEAGPIDVLLRIVGPYRG